MRQNVNTVYTVNSPSRQRSRYMLIILVLYRFVRDSLQNMTATCTTARVVLRWRDEE